MKDRLLVAVLGHRNAGKSTTWYRLFGSTVRTGTRTRRLYLNPAQYVEAFLMSGSPQERGLEPRQILPRSKPKIVLSSIQYVEDAIDSFQYFLDQDYDLFVQWINPGYNDASRYPDSLSMADFLLNAGATLQYRSGHADPAERVSELRQAILGWATHRDLVNTEFPR